MKKLLCILSLLIVVTMLSCMGTIAAQAEEEDDLYAIATVDGEAVVLSDAPDAGEIGDYDSYELIVDSEPVLTVEQSDVPDLTSGIANNGWFSAEFDIPETTKHVFLAGLSAEKVAEIQQKLIAKFAAGSDFELEDLSFIDTEKTRNEGDGDDYLCWAAASSNVLTYTGWATQANRGFTSTDDVFEDFIASFTDQGSNAEAGFGWFFNGVNYTGMKYSNAAYATSGTGGYLNDYAFDQLSDDVNVTGPEQLGELDARLHDGCGCILSADVYYEGDYFGGHSIACWGTVIDAAYEVDDNARYIALLISDSDSNELMDVDRREAPNIIQAVSLTAIPDGSVWKYRFAFDQHNDGELYMFSYLLPYSPELEKETASDASRNKVTTTDAVIRTIYLGTDFTSSNDYQTEKKIESGAKFFYTPKIENVSDQVFSGTVKFEISIKNADGVEKYSRTFNSSTTVDLASLSYYPRNLTVDNGLSAGDYTITISMNSNHTVSEAYYYNNTASYDFKVRDSYLLGDADGDGDISITDATLIQRYLARYSINTDEALFVQRAAITGEEINIVDATMIQRHLALYSVNYPIGEKQLYD